MIVVTGAAGFIGSCIVARLNELGHEDLILVDHMPDDTKKINIEDKKYEAYYDKVEFLDMVKNNELSEDITTIIHMGACSSTTLTDEKYYTTNNLEYTKSLALWTIQNNIRFIYASSAATYGDGEIGYKDDDDTILNCKPLNLYGESKQKFDVWALENNYLDKMVGLKFFNVFGPNEYHKGSMRSLVAKAYQTVVDEGKMGLFKSYVDEYSDGEQKRDFIYVKDAVDVVMFFFDHPEINGVYNVGTGQARSWNDLAHALFRATKQPANISYIDMPEILRDKYQYFTQANMDKLKSVGYSKTMTSLEDAIQDYVHYLKNKSCW